MPHVATVAAGREPCAAAKEVGEVLYRGESRTAGDRLQRQVAPGKIRFHAGQPHLHDRGRRRLAHGRMEQPIECAPRYCKFSGDVVGREAIAATFADQPQGCRGLGRLDGCSSRHVLLPVAASF